MHKITANKLGIANLTVANDSVAKHITDIELVGGYGESTIEWCDSSYSLNDTFYAMGKSEANFVLYLIHDDGTLQRIKTIAHLDNDEDSTDFETIITTGYPIGSYIGIQKTDIVGADLYTITPIFQIRQAVPVPTLADDYGIKNTEDMHIGARPIADTDGIPEAEKTTVVARDSIFKLNDTINFIDFPFGPIGKWSSLTAKIFLINPNGTLQRYKTLGTITKVSPVAESINTDKDFYNIPSTVITSAYPTGSYVVIVEGKDANYTAHGTSAMFNIKK